MLENWFPSSKDHLPLTWWKGHPVYLAAVVAMVGAASMVVFALLGPGIMNDLAFSWQAFRTGRIWTPVTYILVNFPSLWTLIGCFLLWRFGEAVERHLGRQSFVKLLLLLLLSAPLLLTLWDWADHQGRSCAGIVAMEFGVFIAFATLYPTAKISIIILSIDAWVLAAILVGVSSLQSIAIRDWSSLLLLAANVGTAYAYIRHEQGAWRLPAFPKVRFVSSAKPKPKPTARPSAPGRPARSNTTGKPGITPDAVLDKIAKLGIDSLTPEEREVLQEASDELKRRRPAK